MPARTVEARRSFFIVSLVLVGESRRAFRRVVVVGSVAFLQQAASDKARCRQRKVKVKRSVSMSSGIDVFWRTCDGSIIGRTAIGVVRRMLPPLEIRSDPARWAEEPECVLIRLSRRLIARRVRPALTMSDDLVDHAPATPAQPIPAPDGPKERGRHARRLTARDPDRADRRRRLGACGSRVVGSLGLRRDAVPRSREPRRPGTVGTHGRDRRSAIRRRPARSPCAARSRRLDPCALRLDEPLRPPRGSRSDLRCG